MIRSYLRLAAALAISFVTLLTASAQAPKTADLKGLVINGQEVIWHGYVAELAELAHPGQAVRTDIAADGAFVFREISYGDYVLRITNYYGTVLNEQFVTIREIQPIVEVRLFEGEVSRPANGSVSMRELQHPPAHKAVGAALAAERFAKSGRYDRAAEELQKAIRISPEFAQAHSILAVQYIRLQRFAEAGAEIERAMAIAGRNPVDLSNLAFIRTALQQYDDASATAREALRIDPNYAKAHYILGTLLLLHNETRPEGIAHLERAAVTIAAARAALERVKPK